MKKSLVLLLLMLGGCVSDLGRFTILSTKNTEISRVDLMHVPFKRDVTATRGRLWILFIPIGSSSTPAQVVDDCLTTGAGDFMTSARLESFSWSCGLVSWSSLSVTGDVGNSLGEGARELEASNQTRQQPWRR